MQNIVKTIDMKQYMPVLKELLNDGHCVPLIVTGSSMNPFLAHLRDTIYISKPKQSYRTGDLVFYVRASGQHVMHRVHHVDREHQLYLVGDAQTEIEGPVSPNQVFGSIYKVIRKGKVLQKGDFLWWFFERIWIRMVPLRGWCKNCYGAFKRKCSG